MKKLLFLLLFFLFIPVSLLEAGDRFGTKWNQIEVEGDQVLEPAKDIDVVDLSEVDTIFGSFSSTVGVIGDMTKSVYDPNFIEDDAFDFGNHFGNISTAGSAQIGTTLDVNDNISADSITVGVGSAGNPSLAFSGGDTGFYRSAANIVGVSISGIERWIIDSNIIGHVGLERGALVNDANASAINPTLVPRRSSTDTGIGSATVDQLSLISDGVEGQRITITGTTINNSITFTSMTTIFGDYSAINNMNQILCDATTGDVNIHIVSASGTKGRIGNVKKIDASGNDCIIEPAGGETIDGAANYAITSQWENITHFSDDTNLLIR